MSHSCTDAWSQSGWVEQAAALPVFISRVQHCFSQTAHGAEGGWGEEVAVCETHKLIAGKEDGNKSSRKANVENAVLVYV